MMKSIVRAVKSVFGGGRKRKPQSPRYTFNRVRLSLEELEPRDCPAVFTVTGLGDAGVGMANAGDLRYCITQANASQDASSSITFQQNGVPLAGTITLHQALAVLNKNITIDGLGQITIARDTTQGTPDFRIFDINLEKVCTLRGLTIEYGHVTDGGGAGILNLGTLTLDGCTVWYNVSEVAGGGVFSSGPSLSIINSSSIWHNSAGGPGGGVAINNGNLTVTDSSIDINEALGQFGGGIYSYSLGNNLVSITNSWISGNDAWGGGGIYIYSVLGNPNLVIVYSQIIYNQAVQGGGIFVGKNTLASIQNSVIANNAATSVGGGMLVDGNAVASLDANTIVRDNTAPLGWGNGIFWWKSKGAVLNNMAQMINNVVDQG